MWYSAAVGEHEDGVESIPQAKVPHGGAQCRVTVKLASFLLQVSKVERYV